MKEVCIRQGRIRQGRIRQGRIRQGRIRQGRIRQGRIRQGRIRQGRTSDARSLVQLLASQRMATDIDPVDFIVAEVNCRLLGAARLEWAGTDDAFLRPIVVATEARGTGLGRALLERFFGVCSRISVVARGDAVPFYRHLGFTTMDWSSVPSQYRDECECCGDFAQCRPMSMRWSLPSSI